MTGPPTPPPTSAIEIQDAQREASVPPVATTTAPPEVPPAEGASEAQADEPIVVEQPSQPAPRSTTMTQRWTYPHNNKGHPPSHNGQLTTTPTQEAYQEGTYPEGVQSALY